MPPAAVAAHGSAAASLTTLCLHSIFIVNILLYHVNVTLWQSRDIVLAGFQPDADTDDLRYSLCIIAMAAISWTFALLGFYWVAIVLWKMVVKKKTEDERKQKQH